MIGSLAAAQALPEPSLDPDAVTGADGVLPTASRRIVEGIVVTKDFNTTILAPADLVEFTGLTTRSVHGRRPHVHPRPITKISADALTLFSPLMVGPWRARGAA